MPVPNPKNVALSGAASDLGLGTMLQEQLMSEEERKKRKMQQQNAPGQYGDNVLGNAAMMIFGQGAQ